MNKKYKFKEWDKATCNYHYEITEHGHTMHVEDIVKILNDKELLLKQKLELEKQNEESNSFILEIAKLLNIDIDGVGFDGIQLSIDDFSKSIDNIKKQNEELIKALLEEYIHASSPPIEYSRAGRIARNLERIKQKPIEDILK